MNDQPRLAIIGAGPIGLEAALHATRAGFDVSLFERGQVAENVRRWGHVRLFSPFGMNSSELGRTALREQGYDLPGEDALLTGAEFADAYLQPFSELPEIRQALHEDADVFTIGRNGTWKGDLIGDPSRADAPFRLLVRDAATEQMIEAEFVFDCSGTFGNHNWLGDGGIPCPGELDYECDIEYGLPDLAGDARAEYAGRHTLLIGSGYSAATNLVALAGIASESPETRITWLTRRSDAAPVTQIEDDSLTERRRLTTIANELAARPDAPVERLAGYSVVSLAQDDMEDGFTVTVRSLADGSGKRLDVDRIIANVGYRPDRTVYEELQVHECYASQGPMRLAAKLLGETSADCLAQPTPDADLLRNPEPGFYILGSKSYGRNSRFLMRTGLQQIHDVLSLLPSRAATD
ncbi:dihydropyrimidine dehydrogenase subunit A [Maioricimonas rarisocia]|uniref:Dihydropyrimidine dehydrogenase subunit A n=1 Tax=Maioricimonas rarisocia TaxID=2528026 RepID=A0A517Z3Z3_9PLAN|nr:NAD(P)-binding domain-containing protein [Maioricimonas rarisocia]QDU37198.1 dihydropyrimidine dehydrogenase subunit A [Maioricimonas rarisocia]